MNIVISSLFGISVLGILVDVVVSDSNKYISFIFDLILLLVIATNIITILDKLGIT